MSGSFTLDRQPKAAEPEKKVRRRSFAGAVHNNLFTDWATTNQSADAEIHTSIDRLRSRCRALERDNPYMEHYLEECGANIIGDEGVRVIPKPMTKRGDKVDENAQKVIYKAYCEFSERGNFTADGEQSRAEWSRTGVRSVARDADLLAEIIRGYPDNPMNFAVQAWEADYLSEHDNDAANRITMGVRRNAWNRPIAYRLGDTTRNHDVWGFFGSNYSTKIEREIPAEDRHKIQRGSTAMLLYIKNRFSQSRGWPWASTAIVQLRQLGMYEEAEVVAARIGASKLGFLWDATMGEGAGDEDFMGSPTFNAQPGSITRMPGTRDEFGFDSWDPNNPNGNYPEFRKAMLRGIAAGLKINYNVLGSDLEGVTFSSIRQGVLSERELWKIKQQWWIEWAELPIYRAWLEWSILLGRLPFDYADLERLGRVEMEGRTWGWVDPLKDIQGAGLAVDYGFSSIQREVRNRTGGTFEEIAEEQDQDNSIIEDKQLKLKLGGGASSADDEAAETEA